MSKTSAVPLSPAPTIRHFEVPAQHLLQDWKEAHGRAIAYMSALGVPAAEHAELTNAAIERALRHEPWDPSSDAVSETLEALRDVLLERYPIPNGDGAEALNRFERWRLDTYLGERFAAAQPLEVSQGMLPSMPPLARRAMVPARMGRRLWDRLLNRSESSGSVAMSGQALRAQRRHLPWIHVAHRRRLFLTLLVLIPSFIASGFMQSVLAHQGGTWLEVAIVLFFGALFGWISIGFWTATFGFFTLAFRRDRFAITALDGADQSAIDPQARTAIVMPICEEPVDRVFAGLNAIYESLQQTGAASNFDWFILSDSYNPSTYIKEEESWAQWCRDTGGFGKIFYRRRRVRQKRKSGNVADFCRRWGKSYRYMIMLDADSIMAGDTLVRLLRMMEKNPGVGMIQTQPMAVNRRSLFARVQQFASRVYGPMFAAGLHFWQLGDGQYWGHNTIIRIEPFMDYCGLPRLPGKPPLGGEIMSHDFVEAALMGRAGWTLWLAYDLGGSYEEVPSTLLEEMNRDRRWCQGNLQHLRLLFAEGLFGAHRALFINGVLSYVSALLWNAFLSLSTIEAVTDVLWEPEYFPHGPSLFPEWPIWRPDWAFYLMAVTAMILFLPKGLSILLIVFKQRNAKAFGGAGKLTLSVLLEILLSSLLAPIRMVFHSRFVVQNLLGRTVSWGSQGRDDAETGWRAAIRYHSLDTVVASAWGGALYWLNPHYFWWVTPIIGALILSIPTSVLASRVSLGDRARRRRLFLIPEETVRPAELQMLDRHLAEAEAKQIPAAERDGLARAAVDPYVNAVHRSLLRRRRSLKKSIRGERRSLLEAALAQGPGALDARQRKILLSDPDLVTELHERVWAQAEHERAARWGRAAGGA